MLGYRDINGSINSDEVAQSFISFMEANRKIFELTDSEEIKKKYQNDKFFNLYKYYDISSCFVSDSLIITYKPNKTDEPDNDDLVHMHSANALFIIAMRLQTFIFHCFTEKGLFLRGGISNKYCYIKNNFAVGEGLIEAYHAESTIAKNPRIVLHPEVEKNEKLMEKVNFLSEKMYGGKSIIQRDAVDNTLFLDSLGYAISTTDLSLPMIAKSAAINPVRHLMHCKSVDDYVRRHAEAIKEKLTDLNGRLEKAKNDPAEEEKINSVIEKFTWLKNYHNSKINGHQNLIEYCIQ